LHVFCKEILWDRTSDLRQRMTGGGDQDKRNAGQALLDHLRGNVGKRSSHREGAASVDYGLKDRAERLNLNTQRSIWELGLKAPDGICQDLDWEHDIDRN
jgi:hypothetical protein